MTPKIYDFKALGDEQKRFEELFSSKVALPGIPIIARLDGNSFHNFTDGMNRPYDIDMSKCMIETAKFLLERSCADIAYTQSDEITLIWKNEYREGFGPKIFFNGRVQKLVSLLAAWCTLKFNNEVSARMDFEFAMRSPAFDCRVWQVPNLQVAAENLIWREMDATRNSLNMAVSAYYSHDELQGKSLSERHDMLHAKGINWSDYPAFFKRGTHLAKRIQTFAFKDPSDNPLRNNSYTRNVTEILNLPKSSLIANIVDVFFNGQDVICT